MYGLGGHVSQLGDVAGDQDRLKFLQGQLHAVALAISQARARGDQVDLLKLQALFRAILLEMGTIFARLFKADLPGPIMLGLQRLSDGIQQLAANALKVTKEGVEVVSKSVLWPVAIVAAVAAAVILPRYLPKRAAATNPHRRRRRR